MTAWARHQHGITWYRESYSSSAKTRSRGTVVKSEGKPRNPKPKSRRAEEPRALLESKKVELEQTLFQELRSRLELEALLSRNFPDTGPEPALARYWDPEPPELELSKAAEAKKVQEALGKLSNDLWYFAGSYYMSQLLAQETTVYCYCFAGLKHSAHGSDAMYWRGMPKGNLPVLMSTYLGNFARSGDPNGPDLPVWKPGCRWQMHLGNHPAMRNLETEALEWYEFLAREYFSKVLLQRVAVGTEPGECHEVKRLRIRDEQNCLWPMRFLCELSLSHSYQGTPQLRRLGGHCVRITSCPLESCRCCSACPWFCPVSRQRAPSRFALRAEAR